MRESNPRLLLGRQRPKATRPTPLKSRALSFALRLPVSMRRIVACAGLWAGVLGWSESGIRSSRETCLPPALRRRQGQSELDRADSALKSPEQGTRPRWAMAARRGAGIELFSDCSHHGVALFTRPEFGSQASYQHVTCDITVAKRKNAAASVTSRLRRPLGFAAREGPPGRPVLAGWGVPITA